MPVGALAEEIKKCFRRLASENHDDGIKAAALEGKSWARLGVNKDDVLLILPPVVGNVPADIRLAHFAVEYNVECKVVVDGLITKETLVVLRLQSLTEPIKDAFADVIALILERMDAYRATVVAEIVESLVVLFQAMQGPGVKQIEGLWGELLLMDRSADVGAACAAWHATPKDRFDFSAGNIRVEVKTTLGARQHTFSYEQLAGSDEVQIIVASMMIEEDVRGESVLDLLGRIVSRLNDEHAVERVRNQAIKSLGSQWGIAATQRYNTQTAGLNLRYFFSQDIPCIEPPPLGVFQIKFKADLQLSVPRSLDELANSGAFGKILR